MVPASHSTDDVVERTALIHHEIFQLGALILAAAAAFVLTRAVAASNRDMNLRDAAEWYRRGEQAVTEGRADDAIEALRRATVRDRSDKRYALALARALALGGDPDEARGVLQTLREVAPEDPNINLQLARLAADTQDVAGALRFYHNALYAPWPPEQANARRTARFELIGFLLARRDTSRALSELLAMSTDLPDDVGLRLKVAHLFLSAGDNGHALDQFQRALRLAPGHVDALAGAGEAAFQLGDYPAAGTYLRSLPADQKEVAGIRDVVDRVLSDDPFANRLGSVERRRRLATDFSYAQQRLNECLERPSRPQAAGNELALQDDARAFERRMKPAGILEQDTIEAGIDLIDRIEQFVIARCGPPGARDQALVLIGHQHAGAAR